MATQGERLASLERGLSDHEKACEERLSEIRAIGSETRAAVNQLKNRMWGVVLALLAFAAQQLWSQNQQRIERLERPSAAAPAR